MRAGAAWAYVRGRMKRDHVLLALLIAFVVLFFRCGNLGGWDDSFYWAQLTSTFYDGDLALHDDLLANGNTLEWQHLGIAWLDDAHGLHNSFSIGTTVLDGMYAGPALALRRFLGLARCGPVLWAVAAMGAIFKFWLILLALRVLLNRYCEGHHMRDLAVLATVFGTPLLLYALEFYAMSHLNSALLATLFVLGAVSWIGEPRWKTALAMGLCAGVMVVVRWQSALLVLFVIPPIAAKMVHVKNRVRVRYAAQAACIAVLVGLIFTIQMAAWHQQFGTWLRMPQGDGYMLWGDPHIKELLFSGYHGLLTWSPVVAVCFIGIILGIVRDRGKWRWLMVGALLTVVATTYVNACPADWWGGSSYGARRFCLLVPFFALGLFRLLRPMGRGMAACFLVAILVWAQFTTTCYRSQIDDLSVPVLARKSSQEHPARQDHSMTDPTAARAVVKDRITRVGHSALRLLGLKSKTLDRCITMLIVFALFWLARTALHACIAGARIATVMLSLLATYLALMGFSMAVLFPDTYRMNGLWRQYLDAEIPASMMVEAGFPTVPVDFVRALRHVKNGESEAAEVLLNRIPKPHYPNMTIEKASWLNDELGDRPHI